MDSPEYDYYENDMIPRDIALVGDLKRKIKEIKIEKDLLKQL